VNLWTQKIGQIKATKIIRKTTIRCVAVNTYWYRRKAFRQTTGSRPRKFCLKLRSSRNCDPSNQGWNMNTSQP